MTNKPLVGSQSDLRFIAALFVLSLGLNLFFAWDRYAGALVLASTSKHPSLVGTTVSSFAAKDLQGNPSTVDYAGPSPTVLYVFSPTCGWCERNAANMRELVRLKGRDMRFVGLSLSSQMLPCYVAEHALEFPVYSGLDRRTVTAYGLGATPQLLVVAPDGRVLKSWTGAPEGARLKEIEEFFGVHLPGLTAAS